MKFSDRLADLNCPNCRAQQPHQKLLRTMMGDEDFLNSVPCTSCGVMLRVLRGDGLIHFLILTSSVILLGMAFGIHHVVGPIEFAKFELWPFLKVVFRFGAYLWVILAVIIPLSANFLSVEQAS